MKAPPKPTFAEELRTKRAWMTQREAAAKIGVPLKSYVNWEQGRTVPDLFKRKAILGLL